MVLSGDLVAPRTDLCCSRRSARQGPSRQGSLARIILSYGPLCKGNGNTGPKPHGPHDGTINLCAFTPMLHIHRGALPNQPEAVSVVRHRTVPWTYCRSTNTQDLTTGATKRLCFGSRVDMIPKLIHRWRCRLFLRQPATTLYFRTLTNPSE